MIKTYPTLYSIDSTGKIRIWYQEQNGCKYRTISGVQDGQLVTSEYTICEGKNLGRANETSPIEQATAEIEAKYKKQLKTGYSKTVSGADNGCSYVEPMLAKHYKDYATKIDFGRSNWGIQIKFNGNRCIATKNGLFTRKGEKYLAVPHIENSLKPFFTLFPDAVLDGELFNYDLRQTLNELSKLVRRTVNITAEDLAKSEKIVKFYIYDGYDFDGLNQSFPYHTRKAWIDREVIGQYNYIEKVTTHPIKSVDEMNQYFTKFITDNEEGGILRDLDSSYENKRSKSLLKLKPEMDDEAIILDITEGSGNWSGTGKRITLKWKDKTFDATFKGTYEDCVQFLKDKQEWLGKEVTFLYNDLTGLGIPNFARVDYKNCIKTDK